MHPYLLGVGLSFALFNAAFAALPVHVRMEASTPGTLPEGLAVYQFATDPAGNTYVFGTAFPPFIPDAESTNFMSMLKFDPQGQLLWNRSFTNAVLGGPEWVTTFDDAGNIYRTGGSAYGRDQFEGRVVKLNSNGALVWQGDPIRLDPAYNRGMDIAVDKNGNVAAIFMLWQVASNLVVWFNRDGHAAWQINLEPYGGGLNPNFRVAFDPDGNVLVAGTGNSDPAIAVVMKFNAGGGALWTNRYASRPSAPMGEFADGIVTDRHGNVFVSTFSWDMRYFPPEPTNSWGFHRRTIVSYRPNGRARWTNHVESVEKQGETGFYLTTELVPPTLATDRRGAVYLAAAVANYPPPFGGEVFATKIGPGGRRVWRKTIPAHLYVNRPLQWEHAAPNQVVLRYDFPQELPDESGSVWQRTRLTYRLGR